MCWTIPPKSWRARKKPPPPTRLIWCYFQRVCIFSPGVGDNIDLRTARDSFWFLPFQLTQLLSFFFTILLKYKVMCSVTNESDLWFGSLFCLVRTIMVDQAVRVNHPELDQSLYACLFFFFLFSFFFFFFLVYIYIHEYFYSVTWHSGCSM